MRQVKVEVLGVMDPESKRIRLRAVEPLQVSLLAVPIVLSHSGRGSLETLISKFILNSSQLNSYQRIRLIQELTNILEIEIAFLAVLESLKRQTQQVIIRRCLRRYTLIIYQHREQNLKLFKMGKNMKF